MSDRDAEIGRLVTLINLLIEVFVDVLIELINY